MKKKALITGITGQIGSYLAELLIEKGYVVYGFTRKTSSTNYLSAHIKEIILKYGDLEDPDSLELAIHEIKPDEIFHLAAESSLQLSEETTETTFKLNALAPARLLRIAKKENPQVKVCLASSAQLFGGIYDHPVNEETPFCPKSSYAIAKLASYWLARNYREIHKMFCSNCIIFNSESPRRGENFVTRKITKAVAAISKEKQDFLLLGNLDAKRDWVHARDTARAFYLMLQNEKPDDFVIATGKAHSVREFVELAFKQVGIEIGWKGEGVNEVGYDKKTEKVYIKINPQYFRPVEIPVTIGDASKAKRELGWEPTISFEQLVKEMVEHDLTLV